MADGELNEEGSRSPLKDTTNVLILSTSKTRKLNLSESGGGQTIKEAEIGIGEDTNQYSDSSDQPSNYSAPTSPSKNNTDADTTDYESADEGTYPQKVSNTTNEVEIVEQPAEISDDLSLTLEISLGQSLIDSNLTEEKSKSLNRIDNEPAESVDPNLAADEPKISPEISLEQSSIDSNLTEEKSKSPNRIDNEPAESVDPNLVADESKISPEISLGQSSIDSNLTEEKSKSLNRIDNEPAESVDPNLVADESKISPKVDAETIDAKSESVDPNLVADESKISPKVDAETIDAKSESVDPNLVADESKISPKVDAETIDAKSESVDPNLVADESKISPKIDAKSESVDPNLVADESKISPKVDAETIDAKSESVDPNLVADESKISPKVDAETIDAKSESVDPNLVADESKISPKVDAETIDAKSESVDPNLVADESKISPKVDAETIDAKSESVDPNLVADESKISPKVDAETIDAKSESVDPNLVADESKISPKVDAETIDAKSESVDPNLVTDESKISPKVDAETIDAKSESVDPNLVADESKISPKVDAETIDAKSESVDPNLVADESKISPKVDAETIDTKSESVDPNLVADESKISPKVDAETIDAKLKYLLTNLLDKHSSEDISEKSIDKIETDFEDSICISGSINCTKVNIHRSRCDLSCTESPIRKLDSSEDNSRASHDSSNHSIASINSEYEHSFNWAPCDVSSPQELVIFKKPFDKKDEKLSLKQALIDQEIAQRLNNISTTCTNRNLSTIQEETHDESQVILKNIITAKEGSDKSSTDVDILNSEIHSTSSSFIREDSLEPTQSLFSKTTIMDKSINGLQELYETCSKQERELGCTDVVEPVLFNLSFAAEAKTLADDISKMDINGEDLNEIKPPQYMMQSSLPPEINNSEAGPVTADEDFNKSDYFQEGSFDFEYLSKIDSKSKRTALSRNSLFLKFDPLVGELVSGDLNASNMSERGHDTTVIENNRTPSKNDTLTLVDVTPLGRRSVHSTPSGTKSQGNTPTLKQEVLSKEISKLQHLMVQQEAAHQELLLEKTDEVENLRKRVAELESKAPRDIEERVKFLESENVKLNKELKESLASNKQLTTVMAEYEKTISQLVTNKEEMVSQYEKTKDEIAQERDTAISHLSNMEIAFNDVHIKYEKVKSIVEIQHGNEKLLKESLEAHIKTIEQQRSNYDKLKRHASEKLDGANHEILTLKSNHQMEMAKMNAVAKKSDLKIKSLEESLEQKQKEIRELTQICDELIEQQDKIFNQETIIKKNKENNLNLTFQLPSPRKEKRHKNEHC